MKEQHLSIRFSCGGRPIKLSIRLEDENAAQIRQVLDKLSVSGNVEGPQQSPMVRAGAQRSQVLSIDGAGQLRALASDWQDQLMAFGRKPETAKAYRAVIEVFISEGGWTCPEDINSESVERVIVAKRLSKDWMGDTANRNASIIRGFVKFLTRRGFAKASSSIDDVPRAKSDGTDGVRAATRQEAQRFLNVVCAREMVRNVQPANRTLQHMMMFLAGEAAKLEWKRHMILDAPVPFISWTRDIQKNNRAAEIALHPELAELLRQHRDSMKELSKTLPVHFVKAKRGEAKGKSRPRPVDPDADGSFVFPFVGTCFERDLQRAGIPKTDSRGRAFSPRSARKFFKSELTMLGVDGKIVDFLMRHRGGVDVRYLDLPKDFQLSEVSKLQGLAPDGMKKFVNLVHSWVERRDESRYSVLGEDEDHPANQPDRPYRDTGRASSPVRSQQSAVRPDGLLDANGTSISGDSQVRAFDELNKAACGTGKNAELADLLESLARLLRGSTNGKQGE